MAGNNFKPKQIAVIEADLVGRVLLFRIPIRLVSVPRRSFDGYFVNWLLEYFA